MEPGETWLEVGIAQQSATFPAPALGLLVSISRLVANLRAGVTFELAHYSRWRAIQSCRDLADCFPGLAKSPKRTALFKQKLFIPLSHSNTLSNKCCTWSVNLGIIGFIRPPPALGYQAFAAMSDLAALEGDGYHYHREIYHLMQKDLSSFCK